jgi:AcrR family transcriptional regulator
MANNRIEKKNQTRRQILDAALELSAERGFSSLSLRQVAQQAGIAPTTFYRHFADMDDLGLALVDEVGASLRQLVRQARRRVDEAGGRNVIATSIETFMEFVEANANLFRLLLGEGAGSTAAFRRSVSKEVRRFTDDLAEDLVREAEASGRAIAHVELAAEAMVTVAFNLGAGSIDFSPEERRTVRDRIVIEVRMIMRGAQAQAQAGDP